MYELSIQHLSCCGSFTGKERDSESGNDYFGARYYASTMGRWTSPDPSNWGIDFYNPQTWNHYTYALNNPLRMIDPNGLWPTWVHKDIIERAFPGLSKEQQQILENASKGVDKDQSTEGAYKHGMANGDDPNGEDDSERSADFIVENEHEAEESQQQWLDSGHTGISPAALQAFGNALHTITDETSPSHEGQQEWYGLKSPWAWPGDAWHFLREACPGSICSGNARRQQDAVDRARTAFWFVFYVMSPDNSSVTTTETDTLPDGTIRIQ